MQARVDGLLAAHDFQGAVALVRNGVIVIERAVGMADREAGRAFTPATLSDGASIAKTFTAAAVQLLVAEGRLSLDDPVSRHVAEYPHPATTLRHLLTHSAGLPEDYDAFDADFPPGRERSTGPMLRSLARRQPLPAFAPGTRFRYSSFGYDVAALVVERVAGRPYEAFVRERLFTPLAMTDARPRPARLADWPDRTQGYRRDGERFVRRDAFDDEAFNGGSNWYVSARELARWAGAFAHGSVALPAPVAAAAAARATLADGRPIALSKLSWYCDDTSEAVRCHYPGDLLAFYALAYWDRSRDEAMALVTNHSLPPWNRALLARELIATLAGGQAPASAVESPEPLPRERWPLLVGHYDSGRHGSLTLALHEGNVMLLSDRHGVEYRVFRAGEGVCAVPGLDWWIGFAGGSPPARMLIRTLDGDDIATRRVLP